MRGVNEMRIVGIDASTKSSGIALLSGDGKLIDHKLIKCNDKDKKVRINKMIISLCEVLDEWQPHFLFMEDAWNKINVETSKMLMMIVGGINHWCLENNCEFEKVIPSSWRKVVGIKTGKGVKREELKQSSIEYVNKEYNISVGDDEADAIGLANYGYFNIYGTEIFE